MNFTKTDLYTVLGIIGGLTLAKKYLSPIIDSTLGA